MAKDLKYLVSEISVLADLCVTILCTAGKRD